MLDESQGQQKQVETKGGNQGTTEKKKRKLKNQDSEQKRCSVDFLFFPLFFPFSPSLVFFHRSKRRLNNKQTRNELYPPSMKGSQLFKVRPTNLFFPSILFFHFSFFFFHFGRKHQEPQAPKPTRMTRTNQCQPCPERKHPLKPTWIMRTNQWQLPPLPPRTRRATALPRTSRSCR